MLSLLLALALTGAPDYRVPPPFPKPPSLPRGEHLGLYLNDQLGSLEVRETTDGLSLKLNDQAYRLRHWDDEVWLYDSPQGPRSVTFTGRTVIVEDLGTFRR